jgi:DNA-binding Xre family transcriptional regulator
VLFKVQGEVMNASAQYAVDNSALSDKSYFRPSINVVKKAKKLTVSQELLNEIMAVRKCSLKQISQERKISLVNLRRLKSGRTKNPRSSVFEKILGLYCQVCQ